MNRLYALVLLIFGFAFVCAPATAQGARVALVVGIDEYEMIAPLKKAVGDAEAMSARLRQLGFDVTIVLNPDRRTLNQAITAFRKSLQPGDTALFHFSGHGVEVGGSNLLLASDVPIPTPGGEDFLIEEAIDLSRLMERVSESGAAIRVFVIDACRDNPFERAGLRGIGAAGGLAPVHPSRGSFILYSAGYAQTALDRLGPDDPSPTSVYTRVLVDKLGQPGIPISQTARQVRTEVSALARGFGHDQFPAYYDELTEDIVLTPGTAAPTIGSEGASEAEITVSSFVKRQRLYDLLEEASDSERAGDDVQHFRLSHEARLLAASQFGTDSLEYADASNGIVGALTRMGRVDDAIEASRDAIRIYTKLFGEHDMRALNEKGNLASRLASTGDTVEARRAFEELVRVYDELSPLGHGAIAHAHAYEGYSQLEMMMGDYDRAEDYAARAYQLAEGSGIGDRIDLGWIAANYAQTLNRNGKCDAAQIVYRRAADWMAAAQVPPDHRDHADILEALATGCPS